MQLCSYVILDTSFNTHNSSTPLDQANRAQQAQGRRKCCDDGERTGRHRIVVSTVLPWVASSLVLKAKKQGLSVQEQEQEQCSACV